MDSRVAERAAFREVYVQIYGRRSHIQYPTALSRLPEFALWLEEEVGKAAQTNDKPTEDVINGSRLPERMATGYRAMYAHGMHLRIREAEQDKVTSDSGVAAAVSERRRRRDNEVVDEIDTAEYVGWIEEILELNYRSHCCVVLVCSFIPGVQGVRNSKVERDRYGFLLGNFISTMPIGPKSFAFPTQCQQVFFSKDVKWNEEWGGDWKVICGTDVRGKRGNLDIYQPNIEMLSIGRDSDFIGIRGL